MISKSIFSASVMHRRMKVAEQDAARYVDKTSLDQNYEEIQLKGKGSVLEDQGEMQSGPQVALAPGSKGTDAKKKQHRLAERRSSDGFRASDDHAIRVSSKCALALAIVGVFVVLSALALSALAVFTALAAIQTTSQSGVGKCSAELLAEANKQRIEQLDKIVRQSCLSLKAQNGTGNASHQTGSCGIVCPPGPRGRTGARGPWGIPGNTGPRGYNGSVGPQGPSGPRGSPGSNGTSGPPGDRGAPGKEAPPGKNGTCSVGAQNGSRGPPGPPGPPGAGNLTRCTHKIKREVSQTPGNIASAKVILRDDEPGMKIVGATCSTELAEEYVFGSKVDPRNGVTVYTCECRGMSSLFSKAGNTMVCLIYYWLCPIIS